MEVIWDTDLYVWNIFCGLPGSLIDVNVMDSSQFFLYILIRTFPSCSVKYSFGDEEIDWLYFIADGIYLDYKIFTIPIWNPINEAEERYYRMLSAVRSSFERVFGVIWNLEFWLDLVSCGSNRTWWLSRKPV